MARSPKAAWRFLGALAVWLIGSWAGAQQPDEARIAELFNQARPHLEAVLGARLENALQFKIISTEQLAWLPSPPEVEAQLRREFANLPADAGLKETVRVGAIPRAALGRATVAQHDPGSAVIHVLPQQQAAIAGWDESLEPAKSPAFLQLALVHEAARCVLDSRYQLGRRWAACRTPEEEQVLQALVEGRAQWATRQVARRLGTEVYFPLLARRFLLVPDQAPDARLHLLAQNVLRRQHWAATQGLAFFGGLEEQNFPDAEQRAFDQPPRLPAWVEQPQLYVRAVTQGRRDLAAVLGGLEGLLAAADWQPGQQPWTPEMVIQVASLLGARESAERVVGSWDEARSLVWTAKGSPARQVAVSVVRHQSAAGARAYFGFAMDLQRKRDELSGAACGGAFQVLESRSSDVRLAAVEEAVRYDKRLQFGAQGQPVPVTVLLCRVGEQVIEIDWHGGEADMAWADRLVSSIAAATRN